MTVACLTRPAIRVAVAEDLPVLVGMLRLFITSPDYGRYVSDNAAAAERFLALMLASEAARIFVVEKDDQVTGMLGVMVYRHHMSDELIASEVFWWLDPSHRGYGIWLLKRAEKWAQAQGAVRMQMMHPASKPRVGDIYERIGYQRVEISYQKDLV